MSDVKPWGETGDVLATSGFEQIELAKPIEALRAAGAKVKAAFAEAVRATVKPAARAA